MRFINSFIKENKHFFWVLLLVPILIWFKVLETTLTPQYTIHSALDYRIPFLKIFVVPYIIWFFYIAFGIIYTGLHDRKDFYKLLISLGIGMSIAYSIYMIFPNGLSLRPAITGNDVFSILVKIIYATDTPTNVCPSVHVINSMAINIALINSKDFASKKYLKAASTILNILICLSTVFIKQHSVIDVLSGLIVASVLYICIYYIPSLKFVRSSQHNTSIK